MIHPWRMAKWRPGAGAAVAMLVVLSGCTAPLFRGQSPDAADVADISEPEEDGVTLVGDLAVPWNTTYRKVEGVGFVTQLNGTGSDPPPSMLRDQLIKEMQTHDVSGPARALASPNTAMVIVKGYIPPAAEKGDTFDVEVRVPPRSQTESLEGGWLMQTRLRETLVMSNSVHTGRVAAVAQGPILIDALFDSATDDVLLTRGRVLSAGVVSEPRTLSLVLRPAHVSVRNSSRVAAAINGRFYDYQGGKKAGVAKPMRDDRIELAVPRLYRHNMARYLRVVAHIAVGESATDRVARLGLLENMLLEPTSSEQAALQLEALGREGITILQRGLESEDPEVRFHAAEALAYLDDGRAAEQLYQAARDERAFRWRALTALTVLDQFAAEEKLIQLMEVDSAETRYGAFHALRTRNPLDPMVHGEVLGHQFALHVVSSDGEPMVHVSRVKRPEIVVFGRDVKLKPPAFLFAGKQILIKGVGPDQVKISRFRTGKEPESVVCSTDLDQVVRTIVDLGGGYADVLRALQEAREHDYLACRLELDARPGRRRAYRREEAVASDEEVGRRDSQLLQPIPDLFLDRLSREANDRQQHSGWEPDLQEDQPTKRSFFARMTSWWAD